MEVRRHKRFLLISIIPQQLTDSEVLNDLKELKELVESYGGLVIDLITQRREIHDKGNYIGNGKMNEAAHKIIQGKIDVVVLNGIMKSGQIYEMKNIFMKSNRFIEVWDRVDLILQIFARHAKTKESKLQIELAAMRHMGPRIYGTGMELSQQMGGIGTRGLGETNTELMKRHWSEQMKRTHERLTKIMIERMWQLKRRKRAGLKTVSLVGYTNAGKTSLFNRLTKKNKMTRDALFVTLDSIVGKMYLHGLKKEILISDTIGFIKNLPMDLVDSFKSTLLESIHSDIILHVVDASGNEIYLKTAVVEEILNELGIAKKNRIYVFNKIDTADRLDKKKIQEYYQVYPVYFISSKSGEGLDFLISGIEKEILKQYDQENGRLESQIV